MTINNVNNGKNINGVAFTVEQGNSITTNVINKGVYILTVIPNSIKITINGVDDNTGYYLSNGDAFVNKINQKIWISSPNSARVYLQSTEADIPTVAPTSTLETISATGTYTQTGSAKVLVIGGGQGGTLVPVGSGNGGSGGRVAFSNNVTLPGSVPVVIGAGGPAPGNDGGDTSFGTLTSAGGVRAVGTVGPGTPGETILGPTGFLQYLSPVGGGIAITSIPAPANPGLMNGGIAAAGGGTIGGPTATGGGGGGVVAPNVPSSSRSGGAGRVYLVRMP